MKANELCVGDWVQTRACTIQGEERLSPPMRVCSLGEDWVCTRIDPEQGDPFDDDIEDVRPIPLTENILLINGFEKESSYRLNLYIATDSEDNPIMTGICVTLLDEGRFFFEVNAPHISLRLPINSVHTLQHVLRLAGIEKEIKL